LILIADIDITHSLDTDCFLDTSYTLHFVVLAITLASLCLYYQFVIFFIFLSSRHIVFWLRSLILYFSFLSLSLLIISIISSFLPLMPLVISFTPLLPGYYCFHFFPPRRFMPASNISYFATLFFFPLIYYFHCTIIAITSGFRCLIRCFHYLLSHIAVFRYFRHLRFHAFAYFSAFADYVTSITLISHATPVDIARYIADGWCFSIILILLLLRQVFRLLAIYFSFSLISLRHFSFRRFSLFRYMSFFYYAMPYFAMLILSFFAFAVLSCHLHTAFSMLSLLRLLFSLYFRRYYFSLDARWYFHFPSPRLSLRFVRYYADVIIIFICLFPLVPCCLFFDSLWLLFLSPPYGSIIAFHSFIPSMPY